MRKVPVHNFYIGDKEPLTFIAGPCVIESQEHCLVCAHTLKEIFSHFGMNFIFKASYDKANRMAIDSYRGPGLQEGLRILQRVKAELELPIITDVHSAEEVQAVAEVCDIIQIPAFLCRQTDLLVAAGKTGKTIELKKGQFMAPWDMEHAIKKIQSTGNEKIIVAERGTTFGYNNLVSDMRSIPIMKKFGFPILYDATHSVQLPGGQGSSSGGNREFVPILAKAALVAGASALYMEAHPNPTQAKSDAATQISFADLPQILVELEQLHALVSNW